MVKAADVTKEGVYGLDRIGVVGPGVCLICLTRGTANWSLGRLAALEGDLYTDFVKGELPSTRLSSQTSLGLMVIMPTYVLHMACNLCF